MTIRGLLYSSNHRPAQIFRLLEELPNLSDLVLHKYHASIRLSDLALLVQVTQRTSLRHLTFTVERGSIASGLPISGPGCLSTLCVSWRVHDEPGTRGKSLAHLSEFLRPSLATLTRLKITDFDVYRKPTDLEHIDFRLWSVCPSVRNFRYKTRSRDTKVLDAVSETFPNLTHLAIVFDSYGYNDWGVWTV
ncbi:hypothetical protein PILCRDRAFT_339879 [Piloderma croceum F 1598]|uniref:F-box domain-containing protein n=1 Tax=Piloderma croceum (strain F 1598) TaxID=765440 RepID=A0A0C3C7K8_PILCF|nr:hypothetical protein PILCRDRAFT_339879 [Piloderma croceum F 1598]